MIKVTVTSSVDGGHYRIGRHWPREATEAVVTPDELEILHGDGRLKVVEGEEVPDDDLPIKPNIAARAKLLAAGLTLAGQVGAATDEALEAAGLTNGEIAKVRKVYPQTAS